MKEFLKQLLKVMAILSFIFILCCLYVIVKINVSTKYTIYYTSYVGLTNMAFGLDDYNSRNKNWPTNMEELLDACPHLAGFSKDGYENPVIFVPYNKDLGYGKLISYGRDGKPGGTTYFDRDLEIRFPTYTKTNKEWNQHVGDEFTNRTTRGMW